MAGIEEHKMQLQNYKEQSINNWPTRGRHILANFDEDSIVVYQAFNPFIAEYAVANQRFGGDRFSFERMSWIKTNFMWMMYRCGWASKPNQERVLAVRIKREGFEKILAEAYTVTYQKSMGVDTHNIEVRLQWDPDHTPSYEKLERRAIQLGLKGNMLKKYGIEWIVEIKDITPFVYTQRELLNNVANLMSPVERIYIPQSKVTIKRINLTISETDQDISFKECKEQSDDDDVDQLVRNFDPEFDY